MKEKLHPKQQKILELLKEHKNEPLSLNDMKEMLGLSGKSVVHYHIKQLEDKGYLRRNPANPRDYQILKDGPDKDITYLNLYGMAQCGPDGRILSSTPMEKIATPSKLLSFDSSKAFLVRAQGKSMEPEISPGDLVIAEETQDVSNKDIIVCTYEEEVLIKEFRKTKEGGVVLVSKNDDFPLIEPKEDEFNVEGKVREVLNYYS